ncbi:CoA ester lyase [Pelistega sp. NLN82]|uniref:CoA ester lyase n=1 Tax=Pelistega ratti TaxID=2652177 RepID=A0A6L9Y7W8_9BURK|nr:CoA ester lyase [Pelistega ratti]NEN75947.1 CoA ester lyase [Pelistega ratti]
MKSVIQSALFVPATRIDRIEKAMATGVDVVIVDFEDAVAIETKEKAQAQFCQFLQTHQDIALWVRVNGEKSAFFEKDLAFCAEFPQIKTVMLPKAESSKVIQQAAQLSQKKIFPLIESAKGIANLNAIVHTPAVIGVSFGALDLAVDLGFEPQSEGGDVFLNQLRYQLILQSRLAGIQAPLEAVYPDFKNIKAFFQHIQRSKQMGMAGVLCIHPQQVFAVQRALQPKTEQIQWATGVLAEYERTGLAAFAYEGQMVDLPVLTLARELLNGDVS